MFAYCFWWFCLKSKNALKAQWPQRRVFPAHWTAKGVAYFGGTNLLEEHAVVRLHVCVNV